MLAAIVPAVHVALPCPYPGMRPYSANDADRFRGRRAEVEELLGRLRTGERDPAARLDELLQLSDRRLAAPADAIAALVTSMLFTLLALPTFYELVHRIQTRMKARGQRRQEVG